MDNADPDLVELVLLPPMEQVDRPAPGDIPLVENRLLLALQNMVTRVRNSPSPAPDNIRKVTGAYGWAAVCGRSFQAYASMNS